MKPLFEQYRARKCSEVIGQGKAIKRLEMLESKVQSSGSASWISGKRGPGKTSIARRIPALLRDSPQMHDQNTGR